MLNAIWAMMILIGVVYGSLSGNLEQVSLAALDSSKEAVSLCITMLGVMAFWVGLMEIAKKAGILEQMTQKMDPLIRFLFPRIPKEHKAREYIATNIVANILGLGWACTPAGLKGMEELARLEKERGNEEYTQKEKNRIASNEMCIFLVLNISSLQVIPINIIAYRSQYGSVNPARIIAPAIIATTCSTLAGIIYCKWKDRKYKHYSSL